MQIFVENYMAIPVVQGIKSEKERFAGAEETYCIEALMQDGKALQAGTSHFLGQNFAKAFNVKFATKTGELDYVWATSWGVSTRLVGALVMTHGDDNGLIIPPNLAPTQVVIVPVYKSQEEYDQVKQQALKIHEILRKENIRVYFDSRQNQKPGFKFNQYELEGVPLRITIGPRDLKNSQVELNYRLTLDKELIPIEKLLYHVKEYLKSMQKQMFNKALNFRNANTRQADTFEEFKQIIDLHGGFISAHWDGTTQTENEIQTLTRASIRCIPEENQREKGKCIYSGKPSAGRVLFARAY